MPFESANASYRMLRKLTRRIFQRTRRKLGFSSVASIPPYQRRMIDALDAQATLEAGGPALASLLEMAEPSPGRMSDLLDRLGPLLDQAVLSPLDRRRIEHELATTRVNHLAAFYAAKHMANWGDHGDALIAARMMNLFPERLLGRATKAQQLRLRSECLIRAGRPGTARELLLSRLREGDEDDDLHLWVANSLHPRICRDVGSKDQDWFRWVNPIFTRRGLAALAPVSQIGLDHIRAEDPKVHHGADGPLVSVLMSVFNNGAELDTAIRSVLDQTWRNLELILVDDASQSEATRQRLAAWSVRDNRIRLLTQEQNCGTYTARNAGLAAARGTFVTCHDADDWSHPQKIEFQVKHLFDNPEVVGNLSRWVRVTDDMEFSRFSATGKLVYANRSSLLFRRDVVMDRIGYWDSVRKGADSEFENRLKRAFPDAVSYLETPPLSFGRVSENALTSGSIRHGWVDEDRAEYWNSWHHWQSQQARHNRPLVIEQAPEKRHFPAPQVILPQRPKAESARPLERYDVVIASDFRIKGGSTASSIAEVEAQHGAGLRTGLIQLNSYRSGINGRRFLDYRTRVAVQDGFADRIMPSARIQCGLLLLRYPPCLNHLPAHFPHVEAGTVKIIVNQPPTERDGSDRRYWPEAVHGNALKLLGTEPLWHPIGPLVREALEQEGAGIPVAADDWYNVIDVDAWKVERAPLAGRKPVIGRHSRDDSTKWPASPAELLQAYPDSEDFHVQILGGAKVPKAIVGELPSNWTVHGFNALDVKKFLSELDFFVYFHNPVRIEAFGRTIIEAMASGALVVLPRHFEALFGEAAIYALPAEVEGIVRHYAANPREYAEQVSRAERYTRANFGFEAHLQRLAQLLPADRVPLGSRFSEPLFPAAARKTG